MNSTVSVCLPTLNGAKYLPEALASLKKQTYKDLELIVSDDYSNDDTFKIVQKFKKEVDFPVLIFKHEPNGIGANWNNCIKKANGKYIKFLFQDDILFPTCIEKLVQVIEKDNYIGLVASKRKFILEDNPNPEIRKWVKEYGNLQDNLGLPNEEITIITRNLFKTNTFFLSPPNKIGEPVTVLFEKKIVDKVGYFREDLMQVLDYEFYYRILKVKKIAIVNEELVGFRIHPEQATNINRKIGIGDYKKYDRILYEDYFWYFNFAHKLRLFKKYNDVYGLFTKLKNGFKRKM